jgi:putative transposase
MSHRLAFIQQCVGRRRGSILSVCARFGISEKTGQKWLARFRLEGPAGLADRSHATHGHPNRLPAAIAHRLITLRRRHPLYGASKLRDWLLQHEPETAWPAASTIGALLAREGLITPRRRHHHAPERAQLERARTAATAPNRVWTADFKGQFRVGAGTYCYPLTVLDLYSHFLLGCTALPSTAVGSARRAFERLFRLYGLPDVLRTDNGVPFAQPNALGRLGALAFWWVRLGIRPEHTPPAHPAANGAHERFHKTLKAHTARPAASSFAAQQRRFDRFHAEYNDDRPHAHVVDRRPPATVYTPSLRPYPRRLPALIYPDATMVRLVAQGGFIKLHNTPVFLSRNLAGDYIGLTETADDQLTLAYGALLLGEFDLPTKRFTTHLRWTSAPTPTA